MRLSRFRRFGLHSLSQTQITHERHLLRGAKAFEVLSPIPHLLRTTTSHGHGNLSIYFAGTSLKQI